MCNLEHIHMCVYAYIHIYYMHIHIYDCSHETGLWGGREEKENDGVWTIPLYFFELPLTSYVDRLVSCQLGATEGNNVKSYFFNTFPHFHSVK
jgi:hypothetical protein